MHRHAGGRCASCSYQNDDGRLCHLSRTPGFLPLTRRRRPASSTPERVHRGAPNTTTPSSIDDAEEEDPLLLPEPRRRGASDVQPAHHGRAAALQYRGRSDLWRARRCDADRAAGLAHATPADAAARRGQRRILLARRQQPHRSHLGRSRAPSALSCKCPATPASSSSIPSAAAASRTRSSPCSTRCARCWWRGRRTTRAAWSPRYASPSIPCSFAAPRSSSDFNAPALRSSRLSAAARQVTRKVLHHMTKPPTH